MAVPKQALTRVSISRNSRREMTHSFPSQAGEVNFHISFSSRFSRFWEKDSLSPLVSQDFILRFSFSSRYSRFCRHISLSPLDFQDFIDKFLSSVWHLTWPARLIDMLGDKWFHTVAFNLDPNVMKYHSSLSVGECVCSSDAKITRCASICWPSSQAKVTSANSLSSLRFPSTLLMPYYEKVRVIFQWYLLGMNETCFKNSKFEWRLCIVLLIISTP